MKLRDDGTAVTQQTIYLINKYGRLRDVLVIPDGRVFICTSNKDYAGTPGATDDRIIELKNQALDVNHFDATTTSIYPVPSDDMLYIESNSKTAFISIIDTQGKEIYTAKYSTKVDVSKFASGMYYLQLMDTDKRVVEKKKILVK